jgi:hypothetical protein
MVNPHTTHPFAPVFLGFVIMAVGPALLSAPVITTLTATPLRQAVSATILLVLLAAWSFWIVSRGSVHTAAAVEGGES